MNTETRPALPKAVADDLCEELALAYGWHAPAQRYLLKQVAKAILSHHVDVED